MSQPSFTQSEQKMMLAVLTAGSTTANELAEVLNIKRTAVHKTATRLWQAGYLSRKLGPTVNGRPPHIYRLTKVGAADLLEFLKRHIQELEELYRSLENYKIMLRNEQQESQ